MSRVRLCGASVFKRHLSRRHAETAMMRAEIIGSQGILTPKGRLARHGRLIEFERISGLSGQSALIGHGRLIEAALLSPIVSLHAHPYWPGLPRFDPLAKIIPRLDDRTAGLLKRLCLGCA